MICDDEQDDSFKGAPSPFANLTDDDFGIAEEAEDAPDALAQPSPHERVVNVEEEIEEVDEELGRPEGFVPPDALLPIKGDWNDAPTDDAPKQAKRGGPVKPERLTQAACLELYKERCQGVDPVTVARKYGIKLDSVFQTEAYVDWLLGSPDGESERMKAVARAYLEIQALSVRCEQARITTETLDKRLAKISAEISQVEDLLYGQTAVERAGEETGDAREDEEAIPESKLQRMLDRLEKRYRNLLQSRQYEVKSRQMVSGEIRQYSVLIAELSGVRKTRPGPKKPRIGDDQDKPSIPLTPEERAKDFRSHSPEQLMAALDEE